MGTPPAVAAQTIADAVAEAWHGHHGSGRCEIAVGTVAGLALLWPEPGTETELAARLTSMDGPQLIQVLERIWALRWLGDPYLVDTAHPIRTWLEQDLPEQAIVGVRAVAAAAMRHGLLQLTRGADPYGRAEADVLGPLITAFRPRSAYTERGQIHTPQDLAEVLARLAFLDLPAPGASFDDPAAGSGGLMRAAAQVLRDAGRDPADHLWSMGDIDPLSAACCATNAMIWGLGPSVLIFHGNTLAQGDGPRLATQRRAEVLAHHANVVGAARIMAATLRAERLLLQPLTAPGAPAASSPGHTCPPVRRPPGRGQRRRPSRRERADG